MRKALQTQTCLPTSRHHLIRLPSLQLFAIFHPGVQTPNNYFQTSFLKLNATPISSKLFSFGDVGSPCTPKPRIWVPPITLEPWFVRARVIPTSRKPFLARPRPQELPSKIRPGAPALPMTSKLLCWRFGFHKATLCLKSSGSDGLPH